MPTISRETARSANQNQDAQGSVLRGLSIAALQKKKVFQQAADGWLSDLLASPPDEKNKGRDQSRDDQHPVLAFKTEKYKALDEKLHRSRPQFWAE
ncbi:hypothetical protein [Bradyrhizobium sp. dw_411]|uniref:hypothetical protein n=1 Tax=Bradyrhizobium sp. dw_411 TaxID=2720082 RepID=UPI001BCF256D|nr:hypothetical protein [Bradyrhizobium sp. dw_411]